MPITTADWLRLIDSISGSSTDREALLRRLKAEGADPERADWLVSLARRRRIGRGLEKAGTFIIGVTMIWLLVDWILACTGSPNAPGMPGVVPILVVTFAGEVMLVAGVALQAAQDLDLFAFPRIPAQLRPPPRQVRPAGRERLAIVALGGVICVMAAAISMFSLPRVRNATWLRQRGVETSGRVIDRNTRKGSKGSVSYTIRYAFPAGESTASVSRARYDAAAAGDSIPVTYLPDRPEISEPLPKRDLTLRRVLIGPETVFGAVYLLLLLLFVPLAIRHAIARQQRIAERGVPVIGHVADPRRRRVGYLFPTPSGEMRGSVFLNKRRTRTPPEEGAPLTILYDPDDPRRNSALGALDDFEID